MSLGLRFDTRALRPPQASDAAVPAALLAWCRQAEGPFAWCETAVAAPQLDALMRELDGDARLQQLSRAAGLRWRLGLKLREALGLRRATDPWDCGHARSSDALLHFLPRRPTVIVSSERSAQAVLAARAPLFQQPVRLLLQAA